MMQHTNPPVIQLAMQPMLQPMLHKETARS